MAYDRRQFARPGFCLLILSVDSPGEGDAARPNIVVDNQEAAARNRGKAEPHNVGLGRIGVQGVLGTAEQGFRVADLRRGQANAWLMLRHLRNARSRVETDMNGVTRVHVESLTTSNGGAPIGVRSGGFLNLLTGSWSTFLSRGSGAPAQGGQSTHNSHQIARHGSPLIEAPSTAHASSVVNAKTALTICLPCRPQHGLTKEGQAHGKQP
jgi:hypothetical protein